MKQGVDYVGVGVGAVIVDKKGRVFLSKRGRDAQNEVGKWECPGGSVNFGETMEKTIIREMKEEFGVLVEVLKQLETVDHLIEKNKQHWVAVAYLCRIIRGEPKILEPNKSEAIGWFTVKEMETMPLAIPTRHRFFEMKQKRLQKLVSVK